MFFFLAVTVLTVTYAPALNARYMHGDDYFWSRWGIGSRQDVMHFMTIVGRPAAGVFFTWARLVPDLRSMNLLRFFAVTGLAFGATFVFLWVREHLPAGHLAALLSLAIFTLPPFQVFVSSWTHAVSGWSVTLSALALLLADRSLREKRRWARAAFGLLAVGVLFVAFCCYQPSACFFLALLVFPVILDRESRTAALILRLFRYGVYFGLGVVAYYVWLRVWLALDHTPPLGKYDARAFVGDYSDRLRWFVSGPVRQTLNFWNIFTSTPLAVCVGVVTLYSVPRAIFSKPRETGRRTWRVLECGVVMALIPATFFVSLLSSRPSEEYRTYAALGSLMFFLLFVPSLCVDEARRALAGFVLAAVLLVGVVMAHVTVRDYFVRPNEAEVRFLMDGIRSHLVNGRLQSSVIHVVQREGPVAPAHRNEIGEPSVKHGPNIKPIVRTVLHELGITEPVDVYFSEREMTESRWYRFKDTFVRRGMVLAMEEVPPRPNAIRVDMNELPQM
jgi:hypothetical protein